MRRSCTDFGVFLSVYLCTNPEIATEMFTLDPNVLRLRGRRHFFKDQSTYFVILAAVSKNPEALQAVLGFPGWMSIRPILTCLAQFCSVPPIF